MKQEIPAILASDSYKQSHRNQYRKGTEVVYSTWTPRKSRIEGIDKVMTFGIQYFIKDYLIDSFNKRFFNRPKEEVIAEFKRCRGTQFDPELDDVFLDILENHYDEIEKIMHNY